MTPLDLVGDALSRGIFGIFFPLLLLPLAALVAGRAPALGASVWAVMVFGIWIAGVAFALLAPRLWRPDDPAAAILGLALRYGPPAAFLAAAIAAFGGPDALTRRLTPLARRIAIGGGRIALTMIVAMALVQFAVVVMRYVFGVNFIGLQESVAYLHGGVFLLAAGYALVTGDHVRVDILYAGASPRRRAAIDLAGTYLFLFPFCLLTVWTAAPYVGNAWAVREGSAEQSGLQFVFLMKTLIPVFALGLALAGFVRAAEAVATLRGEAPPETAEGGAGA